MLIGVLSDTHDNLDTLRMALSIFRERGAGHVLHAGDWVAPFAVREGVAAGIPFDGVYGNNDGDRVLLAKASSGRIHRAGHALELGGRRFVLLHEPDNLDALAASGRFDVIVHGHDHQPAAVRAGTTLVIDPGECCGWLTNRPTAALLNTGTLEATIVALR